MRDYLQILIFIILGVVLLWAGYSLFMGQWMKVRRQINPRGKKIKPRAVGDPMICPVCLARLANGELIQTQAFPSLTGGSDKQMHIQGCLLCLGGERSRCCPVCSAKLNPREKLIARMFDRPFNRHHVHILGCDQCRNHKRRPPATVERFPKESPISPSRMSGA